jgi:hypothetical protein
MDQTSFNPDLYPSLTRTTLLFLIGSSGSLSLMSARTLLVQKSGRQDFSHPNQRAPVPPIAARHLIRNDLQPHRLPAKLGVDLLEYPSMMYGDRRRWASL